MDKRVARAAIRDQGPQLLDKVVSGAILGLIILISPTSPVLTFPLPHAFASAMASTTPTTARHCSQALSRDVDNDLDQAPKGKHFEL